MPWVRFTRDFDWSPRPSWTRAHKAGSVFLATRAEAAAAIKAGAAVRVAKPGAQEQAVRS